MNQARGPLRDDVRGRPALLDDPVDAGRRAELLAPQPDRAEQQDHRVERVAALPRVRRRRAPGGRGTRRRRPPTRAASSRRGCGRRGGTAAPRPGRLEQPVVDHDLLAAPPLLRRASRGTRSRRRSSSAIAASAIAAPTPDAAIVLWPQPCPSPGSASYSARIPIRGPSPPRPPRRTAADRGRQAAGRVLDLEAVPGEHLRDRSGGAVLLEGGLGVGVDPVRQVEDLVASAVDGGGEAGLLVGVGLSGRGGGQRRQRAGSDMRGGGVDREGRRVARAAAGFVTVPRRASTRRRARG